jgi:tRNA(fMet)-specific endonuclease VapC
MILLDTDHLTILKYTTSERCQRLKARLSAAVVTGESIGTTVINVEEQFRGWVFSLAKERLPQRWVNPYRELALLLDFFRGFHIALFTDHAAEIFSTLGKVQIKSTDRKIAAVAVATRALLLTANARDFVQVPGLKFENWMDA